MRPSVLHKKSYGSVKTFWLDRELALKLALQACKRLLAEHSEVLKAGIFGSIATGKAVPGSDLDVLIVLKTTSLRPLERSAPYLHYFDEIGLSTDLFCFSQEESERSSFFSRSGAQAIWVESPEQDLW